MINIVKLKIFKCHSLNGKSYQMMSIIQLKVLVKLLLQKVYHLPKNQLNRMKK